ncbi:MAG TPA: hypothetical protein VM290_02965 [Gaiellaceae bacterium]|nr:hypothetical protein [Gaiellaceae bacterium]
MRRPRPSTRLSATLAPLALVLALAGCGGGSFSLESLSQVADRTRDEGSSRMDFAATVQVQGETVEMSGEGVFDYEANRGTMTMQVPEAGEMELVVDGTVYYMRFPDGDAGLPEGKRWVRFDVAELSGVQGGRPQQLQQQNPAEMLEYLRASDAEPEEVGTEEVRGVETTHYRAQLDLERAIEQQLQELPEEQRERQRQAMRQQLELLSQTTVPVEVWVDEDGLLRRMTLVMTMQVPAQEGEPVEMRMTQRMELYDYGVEVDVEPPPAAEVVDAAELEEQQGG